MGGVAKSIGNVVTGGPAIGAVTGLFNGGISGMGKGYVGGLKGEEGLFGSKMRDESRAAEEKRISDANNSVGGPPAQITPFAAEDAYQRYQTQYAGRPSVGTAVAQQNAANLGAQAQDSAAAQAAATSAQAQSNLARKGGLSGGARERLGQASAYDALMARQQAGMGSANAQQSALQQGMGEARQDASALQNSYLALLQQNQNMQNQVYAANKGAAAIQAQPAPKGMFGGNGFLGLG